MSAALPEKVKRLEKAIGKASKELAALRKSCKHIRVTTTRQSSFEGVATRRKCRDCGAYLGTRLEC